jgi:hypothetical protein
MNMFSMMPRALLYCLIAPLLLGACTSIAASPQPAALPSSAEQLAASPSAAPEMPTGTHTPTQESTPTLTLTPEPSATLTITSTPAPSETSTPEDTPTATAAPPTPFGEDAIYIYMIQKDSGGKVACGDSIVPINTGLWRTGDVESDVRTALQRLFVKQQFIAGLNNPAYLSNIQVDSVDFRNFQGIISIRLSGTYVRSGDRCDDRRVREQVWSTIRQFSGIKTIDILLNGNLLGDILAGNQ